MSKIYISKNTENKYELAHFYTTEDDSISVFGEPMIQYDVIKNTIYYRNDLHWAATTKLNDLILIYQFSKLAGEIDEVYFVYKDMRKVNYEFVESYCDKVIGSKVKFDIPHDFHGLVFMVFDQQEEKVVKIGKGMVFLTSLNLDIEKAMCKKYKLYRDGKSLNLSWDKYSNINDPSYVKNEGLIWGFNGGPYIDVLNKLDVSGEVLVFDLSEDR